ncbi:MAG TPA: methyltransferase domain-containing protein [Alphaproteobacteria bacterium]|nr:methyltransferase domain-containing protein [Alphaproteobacteria bacterium]
MNNTAQAISHEHKVQQYYDNALPCYLQILGDHWHHGDPDAIAAGIPRVRACEILEERIAALAGLDSTKKVLDFGSGIGGATLYMAKTSGASFTGVTNNERLNQVAREKAKQAGLADKVSFMTLEDTGYKNLPFPDNTFDAITFYDSVCHLPDKARAFTEFARILKPNGRIGGHDWVQRPFGEYQTENQILKFMEPVNRFYSIPWHATVEGYKKMMEDAGLEVFIARDLYHGVKCWAFQDEETPEWLIYDGPDAETFQEGEKALVAARHAGVFSVGIWIAGKETKVKK